MSAEAPEGPYIYQPFGMQDREHWAARRIYAIGGLHSLATVKGLTRGEAECILAAIRGEWVPKAAALREARSDAFAEGVDATAHYLANECFYDEDVFTDVVKTPNPYAARSPAGTGEG